MTPQDIEHVQHSFKQVVPIKEQVAELFYETLFTLDPSLRPMFPDNLSGQGQKLMATLAFVVNGLKQPENIIGAVQDLGCRHVDYGVKPEHYETVGQALLTTLEKGLGESWNAQLNDSWTTAYTLLAGVMKQAAYGHAA